MQGNFGGQSPFSKPQSRRILSKDQARSGGNIQAYIPTQSDYDELADRVDGILERMKSNQKHCNAEMQNLHHALSELNAKQEHLTSLSNANQDILNRQVNQGAEIKSLKREMEGMERLWLEGKEDATQMLRKAEGK